MKSLSKIFVLVFVLAFSLDAAAYVSVKDTKLFLDGKKFFMRGVALIDDSTLWFKDKKNPNEYFLNEKDFAFSAVGGINTVRLPVKTDYFSDENCNLKESGFRFIEKQIKFAKKNDLLVVIDMHIPTGGNIQDHRSTHENLAFWKNTKAKECFVSTWKAIAERFSDRPEIAAYELMNEPSDEGDAYWKLMNEAIAAIRSIDRVHMFIVQATKNNDIRKVSDDNVLYSFHYYKPFSFTHQGVGWDNAFTIKGTVRYPDNVDAPNTVETDLADIKKKADSLDVPVIIGEFGVSTLAQENDRGLWISEIVNSVERLGFVGYIFWREISKRKDDLSKIGDMATISLGGFYSPSAFFAIRPKITKKKNEFDAIKFYFGGNK